MGFFSLSTLFGAVHILGLLNKKRTERYIPPDYPLPKTDGLMDYKVFISNSFGFEYGEKYPEIVCAGPGQLCTETFLQVGPWQNIEEAKHTIRYIKTKFFRSLHGLRKLTQHATKDTYRYVPLQDFSDHGDINWNTFIADIDRQLYKKYGLTPEEINFIETAVKPMEDDLENA